MSDLLDERDGRPATRRRRSSAPLVALLVVLVLLLVGSVVGGRVLLDRIGGSSGLDYEGAGTGEALVQVQPGETAGSLAPRLEDQGVVRTAEAFREVANADPDASGLQPGTYRLRQRMSAQAALDLLLSDEARVQGRVTIPEGFTVAQVLQRTADSTDIPLADLQAAARESAQLGLPAYARGRLEGFLFPATYDVEPGTTAVQVLSQMVDRFEQAADAVDLESGASALGRTPYEVLIVASLVERESRVEDEYGKVARVIYSRLEQGIRLGIDAAVLYGLGRSAGELTQSELQRETPYNTRLVAGLPPTPIANPGQAALQAALAPEAGPWLYYVLASKDGRHFFTDDYQEFLDQRDKSRAEGVF